MIEGPGWDGVARALNRSKSLLESTWAMDGKAVAEEIELIHNETASILKYNDENALKCVVLMAFFSAKAYYLPPNMELPSGRGFADIVYLPKKTADYPALLIELKWNQSAEGAIGQIKERRYADWIKEYTGDILLIGINYDKKKGHECMIERYIYSK